MSISTSHHHGDGELDQCVSGSTGGQIIMVLILMYGKSISCVSVTMVMASRESEDQMMEKRKINECWIILYHILLD